MSITLLAHEEKTPPQRRHGQWRKDLYPELLKHASPFGQYILQGLIDSPETLNSLIRKIPMTGFRTHYSRFITLLGTGHHVPSLVNVWFVARAAYILKLNPVKALALFYGHSEPEEIDRMIYITGRYLTLTERDQRMIEQIIELLHENEGEPSQQIILSGTQVPEKHWLADVPGWSGKESGAKEEGEE